MIGRSISWCWHHQATCGSCARAAHGQQRVSQRTLRNHLQTLKGFPALKQEVLRFNRADSSCSVATQGMGDRQHPAEPSAAARWCRAAAALVVVLVVTLPASTAQLMPEPNPVMVEAAGGTGGRHGDSVSQVSKPSYVLAVDGDVYVSLHHPHMHIGPHTATAWPVRYLLHVGQQWAPMSIISLGMAWADFFLWMLACCGSQTLCAWCALQRPRTQPWSVTRTLDRPRTQPWGVTCTLDRTATRLSACHAGTFPSSGRTGSCACVALRTRRCLLQTAVLMARGGWGSSVTSFSLRRLQQTGSTGTSSYC
jgi:hypothetical protein